MEKLWAPWRDQYICGLTARPRGCIFCRLPKDQRDGKNLIFLRGETGFAVLNLYPYNNGHVLVMPYRHIGDIANLTEAEGRELMVLLVKSQQLLNKVLSPQGFNIGMNLGRVAGAGEPGHLHVHLVPRWRGDVNFMPVVSGTKVISQSLQNLHRRLTEAQKPDAKLTGLSRRRQARPGGRSR